jgi:hypothetical protein
MEASWRHPGECVNPSYLRSDALQRLHAAFRRQKPFPHLILKHFFHPELAEDLHAALPKEEFVRKEADLFSFCQTTKDLHDLEAFAPFYRFFGSPQFLQLIQHVTGIQKLHTIDMSGFSYAPGDHLLPHDDRLAGRKVAYIYYLAKGFTKKDGGALSLFASKNGIPTTVAKSYIPAFNSLALFEVSRHSFHQVDEVLADKERLTIAGWFHETRRPAAGPYA